MEKNPSYEPWRRTNPRVIPQKHQRDVSIISWLTCLDETLIRLLESKLFDHSSWRRYRGLFTFFRRFLFGSGLKEKARLRRLFALWRPLKVLAVLFRYRTSARTNRFSARPSRFRLLVERELESISEFSREVWEEYKWWLLAGLWIVWISDD